MAVTGAENLFSCIFVKLGSYILSLFLVLVLSDT